MANFAGYITNNGLSFGATISNDGKVGPAGPRGEEGKKGDAGATGNGILNVQLVSTENKTKTYRINFTDGTYFEYKIEDGKDGSSSGDMQKDVYDRNNDGIVDNAEKVNGHTVDSDVPADAKFTDTVYDDQELREYVDNTIGDVETILETITTGSGV